MNVGGKIRIYDLARSKVPDEADERTKKRIQAELTRQIIKLAPEFGQSPKTASSSIDGYAVEKIMERIDLPEIISGSDSEPSSNPRIIRRAAKPAEEETKTVEEPKKKLRIVRRLAPQPEATEEKPEEEEEAKKEPETPEQEVEEPEVEEPEELAESSVEKGIQDLINKKPTFSRDASPTGYKDMSNVRSIPLRPVSAPRPVQQQPQPTQGEARAPSKPAAGAAGQPYRVAKPTISSQGMGRKKKRGGQDDRPKPVRKKKEIVVDDTPKFIRVTKPMTIRELAQTVNIAETQIITYFFMKKIIKTVNDLLEKDLIVEYLETQNYLVDTEEEDEGNVALESALKQDETEGNLEQRPPVVTIMGHVDHGKTTLVDTIRKAKAKVVDSESGGITQHISTYRIETEDFDGNTRKITILDTPGHEAFTAMRKRGANVTDIIVLIVAADDGVMPQTIECIKHIKDSKIPFLVAVNKMDKPGANPDKVLGQLAEREIITEEYGGEVECARISALNNEGVDELLMKVMLVADAELSEKIQSNPNRLAIGTIIEAELSRTKGPITTVLVQNGTLKVGDYVTAGGVWGRVKSMIDETGRIAEEARPSTAVSVLGMNGVPKAGDAFKAHKDIKSAKKAAEEIAEEELEQKRYRGLSAFTSEIQEGQEKELRIIIKADVQGSAEAISHELNKLSTGEVLVKPIQIDSGSITSNDIQMAERTGAVVVGFHVGVDTAATAKLAEKLGVKIKSYEIIYKLTEDLERAVLGLHEPELKEMKLGTIEIRKIFPIDGRNIAGSYVTEGKIVRSEIARVFREGAKIYEGKVDYLKRFKDDAKEVKENFECGLSFEKYNDLKEGDLIECWTVKEIKRTSL